MGGGILWLPRYKPRNLLFSRLLCIVVMVVVVFVVSVAIVPLIDNINVENISV